ncbi:MAG: four helix bundle protein [Kiritimatiellaeota bacterium]|nr:four helix bundle protein [Kiritimatiellota bacterium]
MRDNTEFKQVLEKRTLHFSASVINTLAKLRFHEALRNVIYQLSRSATSIGANYREANHCESRQDFIHKISIVLKELNETLYWLDLLNLFDFISLEEKRLFEPLHKEAKEIYALFISIICTAKRNTKPQTQDKTS